MRVRCHAPVKLQKAVTEDLTPPVLHKWMQTAKKKKIQYLYNNLDAMDKLNLLFKASIKDLCVAKTAFRLMCPLFPDNPSENSNLIFWFQLFGEGGLWWKQERGEQAQVITAAIILLCHSSYASAGFLSTDVISREINGNLHGHSCTHGAVNKYTCTLSCIRINTPMERQRGTNPAHVWGGT